jgi:hypothetical protein
MGNSIIQPSFTGGELSPSLFGRVDLARYASSLKTCRNMVAQIYGGAKNRSGTKFLAGVKTHTKRVRLIPFEFSTTQTYVLEFGHLYMRVYKDGAQVVYSSGGSAGQPFELATPWTEADLPDMNYTQSADVLTVVHPGYAPRQISRTDHDAWTISVFSNIGGPFQEVNVDEVKSISASGVTGSVTLTSNFDVFTSAFIGSYMFLESKPNTSVEAWETSKRIYNGTVIKANGRYYRATSVNPSGYARITGTLRPTHTEGKEWDGAGNLEGAVYRNPGSSSNSDAYVGVEWEYLHSGFGIVEITGVSGARTATGTVIKRLPDEVVITSAGTAKTITAVSQTSTGLIRVTATAHGLTGTDTASFSIRYNYSRSSYDPETGTTSTSTGVDTFSGTSTLYVIDANTIDLQTNFSSMDGYSSFAGGASTVQRVVSNVGSETYKWAFEAWGNTQGYPSAVTYHQQRMVFANTPTQPQTVWMSRTGAFPDFSTSNPTVDDDAITFTIASRQVNAIRQMIALDKLVLLTSGSEWVVSGGDNDTLAPSALGTKIQGYRGSSKLPPIAIGNTALYLQEKGQTVRDLGYEFASDSYTGNDLTVLSSHLVEGHQITDWTYQQVPNSVVWAVRDDGVLLGMTYMREQQVIGWHRHDTDGEVESVCCISEGNEDALYLAIKRTINGATKRYVERMSTRFFEDVRESFFVDCGLSYDGRNTTPSHTMNLSSSGGWTYNGSSVFTLASSAAHFESGDVGSEIHLLANDGRIVRLRITAFGETNSVTVTANRDIPAELRNVNVSNWSHARKTFGGLGHIEGKKVSILADGHVEPQQVVTSGSITIGVAAAVVHAGLPIEADFETLDISPNLSETIRDKQKNIPAVRMIVEKSRGIFAGKDAANLLEYKQRTNENYDQPVETLTGLAEIRVVSNWNTSGRIFVRQSDPLPLAILAVIPEVNVGGA